MKPAQHDAIGSSSRQTSGLRQRIRRRARQWFDDEILLLGSSDAIQKLEQELARAPDGWPLLIIAERGSGVANWLLALHIAATDEPRPLSFEDARQLKDRRLDRIRQASSNGDAARTWALLRLDLLTPAELDDLGPILVNHRRILASAHPDGDGATDSAREPTLDRYAAAGFATICHLPPLRQRAKDIEPLLRYFLKRHGFPQPLELAPQALDHCLSYTWPGNERQLSQVAARLAAEFGPSTVSLEQLAEVAPEILQSPSSSLHPALERAVRFIHQNYERRLAFAEVAAAAFTSTSYLSHLFKTELDTRFSSFVSELRVREAQRLIRAQPDGSLELLALEAGFSSLRQMERHFKKQVKESPSEHRQRICR